MKSLKEKEILPAYPRTPHLPYEPNVQKGDNIATEEEAQIIFDPERDIHIEEKVDGAGVGMVLYDGHPIIRNRDHILRKGFRKETAAKMQFASIWTWFYANKEKFEKLEEVAGPVAVYGEWMVAQHGIYYDCLPDWFLAYDLYDYERKEWMDPFNAGNCLTAANFRTTPLLWTQAYYWEQLKSMTKTKSQFAADQELEGIYIKVYEKKGTITHRFKMVRQGFEQGALWDEKEFTKNKLS